MCEEETEVVPVLSNEHANILIAWVISENDGELTAIERQVQEIPLVQKTLRDTELEFTLEQLRNDLREVIDFQCNTFFEDADEDLYPEYPRYPIIINEIDILVFLIEQRSKRVDQIVQILSERPDLISYSPPYLSEEGIGLRWSHLDSEEILLTFSLLYPLKEALAEYLSAPPRQIQAILTANPKFYEYLRDRIIVRYPIEPFNEILKRIVEFGLMYLDLVDPEGSLNSLSLDLNVKEFLQELCQALSTYN
jgi:hypothetical protein